MQPHDGVNFGGLCFACSVFLSRASRGFSLTSVVPFIAHRGRCILVFTHLLSSCSDHSSKNEAYKCGRSCFAALCLVSWIKERSIYLCTVLVSQGFFPVSYGFTVLVSTRGFKRASLELGPRGLRV